MRKCDGCNDCKRYNTKICSDCFFFNKHKTVPHYNYKELKKKKTLSNCGCLNCKNAKNTDTSTCVSCNKEIYSNWEIK